MIGVGAEPICRRIYTPDYRWPIDRDASPWCPTVRLFRQGESRDYAEVIAPTMERGVVRPLRSLPDDGGGVLAAG